MEQVYVVLLLWMQTHGLWAVGLLMFVENVCVPAPTEVGYIAAQSLLAAGLCHLWGVYTWIVVGQVAGAGLSYYLGRASDRAVSRYLARRPAVHEAHRKMRKWYARYGVLTILFGRLIGQVRPWSSFVAGLSGVTPLPFWIWTILGTMLGTGITMWVTKVGYAYWQQHREVGGVIIVTMLVVFYGLPLAKLIQHLWKRHHARRATARRQAEADEVAPLKADA